MLFLKLVQGFVFLLICITTIYWQVSLYNVEQQTSLYQCELELRRMEQMQTIDSYINLMGDQMDFVQAKNRDLARELKSLCDAWIATNHLSNEDRLFILLRMIEEVELTVDYAFNHKFYLNNVDFDNVEAELIARLQNVFEVYLYRGYCHLERSKFYFRMDADQPILLADLGSACKLVRNGELAQDEMFKLTKNELEQKSVMFTLLDYITMSKHEVSVSLKP